jgi:immunoglobulin-binding protein 1
MEEPQSLRSLFASAKAQKNALGSRGDTNSATYREEVTATIAKFLECQRQVSMLSLFSSNELLEDVSTADIQYAALTPLSPLPI